MWPYTHTNTCSRPAACLKYWLIKIGTSATQVLRVLPSPGLIVYRSLHGRLSLVVSPSSHDSFWCTFVEETNLGAGIFPSWESLGLTTVFQNLWALANLMGACPWACVVLWLLRRGPVCVPNVVRLLERRTPWPDMLNLPVSSLMLWEREHHRLWTASAMAVQLDLRSEARFFPWFGDETPGKSLWSNYIFL